MQPLNDLQSVLRTLRDGIGKGYWTMQDLDVPPPGYVGKTYRNLLRDQPADPLVGDVGKVSRAAEDLPDYNESRARTEWLKAELMELERAEKEGELVRADEVSKTWGDLVAITRTKMMAVPSKAKQRIPEIPADAFVALEEIVREALEDLADG